MGQEHALFIQRIEHQSGAKWQDVCHVHPLAVRYCQLSQFSLWCDQIYALTGGPCPDGSVFRLGYSYDFSIYIVGPECGEIGRSVMPHHMRMNIIMVKAVVTGTYPEVVGRIGADTGDEPVAYDIIENIVGGCFCLRVKKKALVESAKPDVVMTVKKTSGGMN